MLFSVLMNKQPGWGLWTSSRGKRGINNDLPAGISIRVVVYRASVKSLYCTEAVHVFAYWKTRSVSKRAQQSSVHSSGDHLHTYIMNPPQKKRRARHLKCFVFCYPGKVVGNVEGVTHYLDSGYEKEAGSEMEKYPLLSHVVRHNAYFYKALGTVITTLTCVSRIERMGGFNRQLVWDIL